MNLLKRQPQRTKLRELEEMFHCSIIGTCLTLNELRQIYRKANFITNSALTDHDIHRIFVGIAGDSSHANRRLQKYLDQKYRRIIQRFAKVRSAQDLKSLWQNALDSGEIAGAYWALVTHSDVTDDLLEQAFGEIHMFSHLSGASVRVDMLELSRLRRRTKDYEKQIADAFVETQNRLKEKDEIIRALNERLAESVHTENKLQQLQTQQMALEKEPLVEQLRKHVGELSTKFVIERTRADRLEERAEQWKSLAIGTEEHNLRLEQKLTQTRQERDSLEGNLSNLLSNADCSDSCTLAQSCQHKDLSGRCILFVGGRSSQCRHFRHLVEQYNGRFIYHDGVREDSHFKLGSTLSQADVVLCPLDCISHDAMNRVKRYCEYNTKQLVMMPRASLSAFAKGLDEVAI